MPRREWNPEIFPYKLKNTKKKKKKSHFVVQIFFTGVHPKFEYINCFVKMSRITPKLRYPFVVKRIILCTYSYYWIIHRFYRDTSNVWLYICYCSCKNSRNATKFECIIKAHIINIKHNHHTSHYRVTSKNLNNILWFTVSLKCFESPWNLNMFLRGENHPYWS